jgi:hypothetical protein
VAVVPVARTVFTQNGSSVPPGTLVNVTNAEGEPLVVWEQARWERPPRGFSWGFSLGYRF